MAASLLFHRAGHRWFVAGFFFIATWARAGGADSAPRHLTFGQLSACPLNFGPPVNGENALPVLPETIRALDGQPVELTGYMLPLVIEHGRARQFLIMRSQAACCFGQVLGPNEYVVVKVPLPGLPVTMDLPLTFRGILRIAPVFSDDQLIEFYSLENGALASR